MTIGQVLNQAVLTLKKWEKPTARLDAEVLLAHLLDVERLYFILNRDQKLDEEIVDVYRKLVLRRCKGEPIAYIVGHQEFMGLDFKVDEHVLIPRPDTEILVEYVIEYIDKQEDLSYSSFKVLDIGSGSGAIGLSIASKFPEIQVTLVDISSEALKVAGENANLLNIRNARFILSDCYEKVRGQYDVIVSNPPYIPAGDIDELQIEVSTYEPRMALDGGSDGLDFYRRIAREGKQFLLKDGLLALEIGYNQAVDVSKILEENGYKKVEKRVDFGGNDRVIIGRA